MQLPETPPNSIYLWSSIGKRRVIIGACCSNSIPRSGCEFNFFRIVNSVIEYVVQKWAELAKQKSSVKSKNGESNSLDVCKTHFRTCFRSWRLDIVRREEPPDQPPVYSLKGLGTMSIEVVGVKHKLFASCLHSNAIGCTLPSLTAVLQADWRVSYNRRGERFTARWREGRRQVGYLGEYCQLPWNVFSTTLGRIYQLPWGEFPIILGSIFNYPGEYVKLPWGVFSTTLGSIFN